MNIPRIAIFLLFSLFNACSDSNSTPELALERFIKYRFSNSQDRRELLSQLVPPLYDQISQLDDAEFSKFSTLGGERLKKLSLKSKNCRSHGQECSIQYVLVYDTYDANKASFETETKKLAVLKRENNEWKVSSISNVKTYHESKKPVEIEATTPVKQ